MPLVLTAPQGVDGSPVDLVTPQGLQRAVVDNLATGSGRILREIYFVGGVKHTISALGTQITASTVWPDATSVQGGFYRFWLVPGGCGGSRGQRQVLSSARGRGGIGGGSVVDRMFPAGEILQYVNDVYAGSAPILVGTRGLGAAGIPAGNTAVAGARGTLGTLSAFGALLAAYPGGLEAIAQGLPGAGGGWLGPGETNKSGDATGGMPNSNLASAEKDGSFGGGHGPGVTNDPATNRVGGGVYGGGGGGTGNSEVATNAGARPAGSSQFGVPGSGAGGGVNTAIPVGGKGGDAGRRGIDLAQAEPPAAFVGGGPVGGAGAVDGNSVAGADGRPGILGLYPGESGAGSGGVVAVVAGPDRQVARGGDGAFPGGCGGSSGEAFPFAANIAIDRGGNGADGVVVIDTF